jgi:hypothetical protein
MNELTFLPCPSPKFSSLVISTGYALVLHRQGAIALAYEVACISIFHLNRLVVILLILITKFINLASRAKRKHRAVRSPSRVAYAQARLRCQPLRLPRTYQQLMFHRDCFGTIGFCIVLLPRIQGDSFVASLLGSEAAARDGPPTLLSKS